MSDTEAALRAGDTEYLDEETAAVLDSIKEALLKPTGRIQIVSVIFGGPSPRAVQVLDGRRKVGPLLFPGEGQDLSDLLALIGKVLVK